MEGKVKWFSKEKGYGFITGQDEVDRYFNEASIEGGEALNSGDWVSFSEKQGNKGPQAIAVRLIERYQSVVEDDRVICNNCGKKMVPLVVFEVNWRGRKQPYHSHCPYCGAKYKSFDTGCFIASAVYGGHDSREVIVLRSLRDHVLMQSASGRLLVSLYYRVSPAIAFWLEGSPRAKRSVRYFLNRLVGHLANRSLGAHS